MAEVTATDRMMQMAPRSGTRGLRRYLIAAVLTRLADEGARVALVLIALQRTNSAAVGGLLVAALLVPQVVAAPAVGLLTDRARQPRWVLTASVVGFAASLAAVAFLLGRVPLPVVVAVLLLGGCCGPSLTGGLSSQLSTLVPDTSLPRAFGADSLTYNLSGIAGPAVAAIISGAAGAAIATLTLAGIAAAGALVLAILPLPVRDRRPKAQPLFAYSRFPRFAGWPRPWNGDGSQQLVPYRSRRTPRNRRSSHIAAAPAGRHRMVDDSNGRGRPDRFAAVDVAAGATGSHTYDGDDRADRSRCSAGCGGDDNFVAGTDRHPVRHFWDLRWTVHGSHVHDPQVLRPRRAASSGVYYQRWP